jgi:serine/threonine protein kinase
MSSLRINVQERPEPYTTPLQYYLFLGVETLTGAEIRVATDFLASMLQIDPADRLTPTELLSHRWLSKTASLKNPCVSGPLKSGV